ncbi:hypothetical protein GMOD_00003949 [Pyrenophora seminiperda CCB06]|uniref:Uncharacterized protein n=1 Tax=Pyrenophora seminiperda CCB06 TaxID=1302712 RepID=A0A3M7M0B7_9PLEO|nr:hypothetical protein GMOD_00003949 [Pyrenophora seminiperda CCB06]
MELVILPALFSYIVSRVIAYMARVCAIWGQAGESRRAAGLLIQLCRGLGYHDTIGLAYAKFMHADGRPLAETPRCALPVYLIDLGAARSTLNTNHGDRRERDTAPYVPQDSRRHTSERLSCHA